MSMVDNFLEGGPGWQGAVYCKYLTSSLLLTGYYEYNKVVGVWQPSSAAYLQTHLAYSGKTSV